ncbi:MAG TPA: hypothetical protein VF778_01975 [Xanthobacteraceae bacterium]
MAATEQLPWGRIVRQAVLAGLAASVLFQIYLWLTVVQPGHQSMPAFWQSSAAAVVVGKTAFASPVYAWLGLLIYLLVGIGWAGGYAYLAALKPAFNQTWPISGVVYGLIVYLLMALILFAGNAFHYPPSPNAFLNLAIAHGVFFGLPIAYFVYAMRAQ